MRHEAGHRSLESCSPVAEVGPQPQIADAAHRLAPCFLQRLDLRFAALPFAFAFFFVDRRQVGLRFLALRDFAFFGAFAFAFAGAGATCGHVVSAGQSAGRAPVFPGTSGSLPIGMTILQRSHGSTPRPLSRTLIELPATSM